MLFIVKKNSLLHRTSDLVGKPVGERKLGRSRHRWEVNIRMYLREIL
jgi:hypothetical protein